MINTLPLSTLESTQLEKQKRSIITTYGLIGVGIIVLSDYLLSIYANNTFLVISSSLLLISIFLFTLYKKLIPVVMALHIKIKKVHLGILNDKISIKSGLLFKTEKYCFYVNDKLYPVSKKDFMLHEIGDPIEIHEFINDSDSILTVYGPGYYVLKELKEILCPVEN